MFGRSIQAKGIEPDIVVEEELPGERVAEGREKDTQLQYALAVLRGNQGQEGQHSRD